jgi:hypothetical protein
MPASACTLCPTGLCRPEPLLTRQQPARPTACRACPKHLMPGFNRATSASRAGPGHHRPSHPFAVTPLWFEPRPEKSPFRKGLSIGEDGRYFFLQSALFLFSCLEQSVFILPPPWLPAKAGLEISTTAEINAEITSFIKAPLWTEKIQGEKSRKRDGRHISSPGQNLPQCSAVTTAGQLSHTLSCWFGLFF